MKPILAAFIIVGLIAVFVDSRAMPADPNHAAEAASAVVANDKAFGIGNTARQNSVKGLDNISATLQNTLTASKAALNLGVFTMVPAWILWLSHIAGGGINALANPAKGDNNLIGLLTGVLKGATNGGVTGLETGWRNMDTTILNELSPSDRKKAEAIGALTTHALNVALKYQQAKNAGDNNLATTLRNTYRIYQIILPQWIGNEIKGTAKGAKNAVRGLLNGLKSGLKSGNLLNGLTNGLRQATDALAVAIPKSFHNGYTLATQH